MTARAPASINRTARLAGGLYVALLPLGIFSFVYVPAVLVVPGDPAATSRNILASPVLFRGGMLSHLMTQVIAVFLVLALYRLFKPVHKDRAVLMVVLALLGIPIAFLNEGNHLTVLRLLDRTQDGAFTGAQLHAQVAVFLDLYKGGILLAQLLWGAWLLPLGLLVVTSGFLPRLLGVLVAIGGAAYVFDSVAQLLFPGTATISQFTFAGELLFSLWLLIKGVNVERLPQAPA